MDAILPRQPLFWVAAQRFDTAVALLGDAGALGGQGGAGGGDGVDGVGLALEPAGLAIGPVDLDHFDARLVQQPGQAGAVGAGALDSDPAQPPERAHPGQQCGVSGGRCGELLGAHDPADRVDHGGGVGVGVGVDTAGDLADRRVLGCNGGHRRPAAHGRVRGGAHRPGGRTRQ